ncbi:MAG: phage terminase large subunit, partial [Eubacterium sp.]
YKLRLMIYTNKYVILKFKQVEHLTLYSEVLFLYTNKELLSYLLKQDLSDIKNLTDIMGILKIYEQENFEDAHKINKMVRLKSAVGALEQNSIEMLTLNKASLLFDAEYDFDAFMQYIEFDRTPSTRFYLPRRRVLRSVVSSMQDLADDKLDTLFLSMPARVGKSTLCIFFLAWLIGKDPEKSNLASAYGDKLTRSFYDGVYEVVTDPTYLYGDVFPSAKIMDTNSKDETLDFGRRKKYKSLTCRSIDGALNGSCDCNGILYGDDLVQGIEEAMSNDRLETLWFKIVNNLLTRQKHGSKSLFVGTRWSVLDPIGRLIDLYENDEHYEDIRYKVVNLPALNADNSSNFEYDYDVGFSTNDFMRKKSTMDEASWQAQCMGQPIERFGLLFNADDLNYYNGGLPDCDPDRIIAACDVAWGGGDNLSMPIGYVYGESCYIHDVVFSKGDKSITRPEVKAKLIRHRPHFTRFEANNGGDEYADIVDKDLRTIGVKLNITSRTTLSSTNKLTRILVAAPDIVKNFYFLDSKHQSREYRSFMRELTSFSQMKKNKHDDAPDSLSMLNDMKSQGQSVQVFKRPF